MASVHKKTEHLNKGSRLEYSRLRSDSSKRFSGTIFDSTMAVTGSHPWSKQPEEAFPLGVIAPVR